MDDDLAGALECSGCSVNTLRAHSACICLNLEREQLLDVHCVCVFSSRDKVELLLLPTMFVPASPSVFVFISYTPHPTLPPSLSWLSIWNSLVCHSRFCIRVHTLTRCWAHLAAPGFGLMFLRWFLLVPHGDRISRTTSASAVLQACSRCQCSSAVGFRCLFIAHNWTRLQLHTLVSTRWL